MKTNLWLINLFFLLLFLLLLLFWRFQPSNENFSLPTLYPTQVVEQITFTPTLSLTPTIKPSNSPSPSATVPKIILPTIAIPQGLLPSKQVITLTPEPEILAASLSINSSVGAYLRGGPSTDYDAISTVAPNDEFLIVAYAIDGLGDYWYLIEDYATPLGWVSEHVVSLDTHLEISLAATIPPSPTLVPSMTLTPAAEGELILQTTPILSEIHSYMREIYLKGQSLGNQANHFAKIGDCNTVSDAFLKPIDLGRYHLGNRYAYLQESITFFEGSFGRASLASEIGMNAASIQDSMWADKTSCESNESPLKCEFRLFTPSVAIIMFGANDILHFTPESYERYLKQIIEYSISNGIIPILTTATRRHDESWEQMVNLNLVVVSLSKQYNLPLINFWLAAQQLPGHGILADNAHLTFKWGYSLNFESDQNYWGHSLRSFLALQMLDKIYREVILPEQIP